MNSSTGFDFSIDNDKEPEGIVKLLDSAANFGWKVKLKYHEVRGYNWFGNRGHTNCFVTNVEISEKNFDKPLENKSNHFAKDTVYMIIVNPGDLKQKNTVLPVNKDSLPEFLKK